MKKRNLDNKGFTLVELIVVLVILAILAAILVPALLGYIDQAKSKQSMINARTVLTAAQAEMSSIYGSKSYPDAIDDANGTHNNNFKATADFGSLSPSVNKVTIACKTTYTKNDTSKPRNTQHDAFTVVYMEYIDAIRGFCKSKGYHFINPNSYIAEATYDYRVTSMLKDHIHPTASEGINLYAEACLEEIL